MTNRLLLTSLILAVLVAVASWLFSTLGYPVGNLFSQEGLRWCLLHGFSALPARWFCTFVLACIAVGCLERKRLRRMGVYLALVWLLMLAFVLWSGSPLRGVSGGLYPSPFVHALPLLLCLSVIVVSLAMSPSSASELLVRGIRRYAILIVFYLIISFIVGEVRFLWQ
ncbi:MAG: hypothetical protein LUI09_00535 [Prevotellaceae bacterium]|nr:hypothetical protein [Prevotellaceae bacterium]